MGNIDQCTSPCCKRNVVGRFVRREKTVVSIDWYCVVHAALVKRRFPERKWFKGFGVVTHAAALRSMGHDLCDSIEMATGHVVDRQKLNELVINYAKWQGIQVNA